MFFPCTKGRPHRKDRSGEAIYNSVQENFPDSLSIPRQSFVWYELPGFLGIWGSKRKGLPKEYVYLSHCRYGSPRDQAWGEKGLPLESSQRFWWNRSASVYLSLRGAYCQMIPALPVWLLLTPSPLSQLDSTLGMSEAAVNRGDMVSRERKMMHPLSFSPFPLVSC